MANLESSNPAGIVFGRIYGIPELCEYLDCNRKIVEMAIDGGYLRGFYVGKRWKTNDRYLSQFMERGGTSLTASRRATK